MEIDKAVEELTNEIRQFNDETVAPIKERLASLEERDTSINDEKVVDLEKRLCEAEARSTDTLNELKEQVRISEAEKGLLPSAGERSSDPFKGFVFRDIEQARHNVYRGEHRSLQVSDLASAGKLNDETASAFLDYVVGDSATLNVIEKRMMNSPTARLDRIGVGTRQLRRGTELTAPADTDGISFTARTLTVQEAIWAEDIGLSFLEDNIAGANAEQQIANVVAKAISEELNDLAWNGDYDKNDGADPPVSTPWFNIVDGFEIEMNDDSNSNVTDVSLATGATEAEDALNKIFKGMPQQYRTIGDLTFFVSPGLATSYADEFSARLTSGGDTVMTGGFANLRYFGIPIIVDRFLDPDKAYLTPASNLVFGVHRDVTQDLDWNPRKRQVEMTVSLRVDFNYKFGGVISRGHSIVEGLE